ncbi:MAG: DUF115 domain-containing protein [Synergistales bacterium]|nr:DUF115 domain-containing protein [Synergistales bacterium]
MEPEEQILQQNLANLERNQPATARRLREALPHYDPEQVQAKKTHNGMWFRGLADEPFFEPNRKQLERPSEIKEPTVYMLGAGSVNYFVYVLKRLPQNVRYIVVIEPSVNLLLDLFRRGPVYKFCRGGQKRLIFVTSPQREEIQEAVRVSFADKGWFVGGEYKEVVHTGLFEAMTERYREVFDAFRWEIVNRLSRLGNSAEDTLLGFRQMALSAPWTLFGPKLGSLKGRFEGRSAVVVSAGPSLDKNLHQLKGREDEFVILCAETVLRRLLKEGIHPHFVCALERGYVVYEKHFQDVVQEYRDDLASITLVAQSVCVPQVMGRWSGPVVVAGKETINMDRAIVRDVLGGDTFISGSSVAHMCLGLADYMGCTSAALIGQDLAFGEGGGSHGSGTAWADQSNEQSIPEHQRYEVPGALGGTVSTTRTWKWFIDIFVEIIPKLHCTVSDCTEGGALIPGTTVEPLAAYLEAQRPEEGGLHASVSQWQTEQEEAQFHLEEAREALHEVRVTFEHSLHQIEELKSQVEEITVKEELNGDARAAYVRDLGQRVTAINGENGILGYIGQSYTASLLGVLHTIGDTKEADPFAAWLKEIAEFASAHRSSVETFLTWARYIEAILDMGDTVAHLLHQEPPQVTGDRWYKEVTTALAAEERTLAQVVSADIFFARTDQNSSVWPWRFLWQLAAHLMSEGRNGEARRLFSLSLSRLQGQRVEVAAAADILKGWAASLGSHDLCTPPAYTEAYVALANAASYAPNDPEPLTMMEQLLEDHIRELDDAILLNKSESAREGIAKRRAANVENLELIRSDPETARQKLLTTVS